MKHNSTLNVNKWLINFDNSTMKFLEPENIIKILLFFKVYTVPGWTFSIVFFYIYSSHVDGQNFTWIIFFVIESENIPWFLIDIPSRTYSGLQVMSTGKIASLKIYIITITQITFSISQNIISMMRRLMP